MNIPQEQANPAKKALYGYVPTMTMYTNWLIPVIIQNTKKTSIILHISGVSLMYEVSNREMIEGLVLDVIFEAGWATAVGAIFGADVFRAIFGLSKPK